MWIRNVLQWFNSFVILLQGREHSDTALGRYSPSALVLIRYVFAIHLESLLYTCNPKFSLNTLSSLNCRSYYILATLSSLSCRSCSSNLLHCQAWSLEESQALPIHTLMLIMGTDSVWYAQHLSCQNLCWFSWSCCRALRRKEQNHPAAALVWIRLVLSIEPRFDLKFSNPNVTTDTAQIWSQIVES